MNTRILPHDLEAERAVLGAVLLRNDAWLEAEDSVDERDFFRDAHQRIFAAARALAGRGAAIDLITLKDQLDREGGIDAVGGPSYLARLVDGVPRTTNVAHYAALVRGKARLRALITESSTVLEAAYGELADAGEILERHETALRTLGAGLSSGDLQDGPALASGVLQALTAASKRGGRITGLETGFRELDRLTTGLQPGDLIVLAARPSMGKTSCAAAMAWHAAASGPVLFVSVEQPTDQIALRVACLDARVNYQRARMGALHADDYARLVESVGRLEASGLHVEDAGRTVAEIRQHARRLSRTKGLALVAIDYLQLLRAPRAGKGERIAGNRAEELGQMTAGLKALAKELRVPVLVLSQLNRVVEQRADKRPQLGDLRESGAIEQDADVVLLLFRQEYYQQTTDNRGQAELVIAKQRNGPTSTIDLFWQGEYMAFSERAS